MRSAACSALRGLQSIVRIRRDLRFRVSCRNNGSAQGSRGLETEEDDGVRLGTRCILIDFQIHHLLHDNLSMLQSRSGRGRKGEYRGDQLCC